MKLTIEISIDNLKKYLSDEYGGERCPVFAIQEGRWVELEEGTESTLGRSEYRMNNEPTIFKVIKIEP